MQAYLANQPGASRTTEENEWWKWCIVTCVYVCACSCVCVCVGLTERFSKKAKGNKQRILTEKSASKKSIFHFISCYRLTTPQDLIPSRHSKFFSLSVIRLTLWWGFTYFLRVHKVKKRESPQAMCRSIVRPLCVRVCVFILPAVCV